MSRCFATLFILLLLMAFTSCFKSGGGRVCILNGPSEIDENTVASFTLSVVGQDAVSLDWMIDPPAAGNFDNPHAAQVKFHVSPLTSPGDLKATIGVSASLKAGPVYTSKQITIKYVPADHQPPLGNLPPVAAAHSDFKAVEPGGTVHFFDDSTDPNGKDDIVKWEWDFSFEEQESFISESEDQNPTHIFEEKGLYFVQLRVTDSTGLSDMLDAPIQIAVTVGLIAPIAHAHSQWPKAIKGMPIQFFNDSIDANGPFDIIKWEWDFSYDSSDGFITESQEQNPFVQFPEVGTYKIQLRVTDASSLSDMLDSPIEMQVVASDSPPVAVAHALSTAIDEGAYVQFIDDSTDPEGQSDIIKWEWDFSYDESAGFQAESEEQNPLSQFPSTGTFEVQLRVTDSCGLSDMLDNPLQISVYKPGWAVSWRAETSYASMSAIAVDKDGNTYVAGKAGGEADFDPGPGEYYLDMIYGDYISKFDANGVFQWAVKISDNIVKLCAGDFDGVYFGVSTGGFTSSAGYGHVSSTGQVSASYQSLGNGYYFENEATWGHESFELIDMFVDSSLNIYVALFHWEEYGYVRWDYDVYPPEKTLYLIEETKDYSISMYSQSGTIEWEKIYDDYAICAIENRHDGSFVAVFTVPDAYVYNEDNYSLALLNSYGKIVSISNFPRKVIINSISCDQNANTFYLGQSGAGKDLDPGPSSYYVANNYEMFLCKLDSNMQFEWGRHWTSRMISGTISKYWFPMVAADRSGNAFITGLFKYGVDVDPGPGTCWFNTYVQDVADAYIIVLGPDGAFKWAALYSNWYPGNEKAVEMAKIAPDSQGYAHLAGCFNHYLDYDPGVGVKIIYIPINHNYLAGAFLLKVSPGDIW